jgi:cold shock CspA family protein
MNERKRGLLRSWNDAKGYGVIRVGPPSSLEKYWLHVSNIQSGTGAPTVGMEVEFEVGEKPVNKVVTLMPAIKADIILPEPLPEGTVKQGAQDECS